MVFQVVGYIRNLLFIHTLDFDFYFGKHNPIPKVVKKGKKNLKVGQTMQAVINNFVEFLIIIILI
jgi:hypothetical protein